MFSKEVRRTRTDGISKLDDTTKSDGFYENISSIELMQKPQAIYANPDNIIYTSINLGTTLQKRDVADSVPETLADNNGQEK